ncbi:PAS domain-containing sensor histidine kinase [Actinomarinicola tropica]|uniref:PAS domain-containing sensor histidine kinase n=1 Tax=Actinomarinicola tropica TaxID=2789776 RepID=UPI0018999010|nr:PAS domain S-box protein [Actinomarinicola tropica]
MTDGSPRRAPTRPEGPIVLGDSIAAALFSSAPDGQVIVDASGRIVLANPQAEQMFGWPSGAMVGELIEELVPERFREVHAKDRSDYHGEPHTRPMGLGLELRARRRDGSEFPVEISLSPVETDVGLLVIAAVRDVSERVAREAHASRIQRSLDAISDGVYMFDPTSLRFTYVNQGAIEQSGWPRAELLTMGPLGIMVDTDAEELGALVAPLIERRLGSRSITTRHRRADGSTLPVEVLVQVPDLGPDIEPTVVAVVRDISERMEQDERLRAAHQELQLAEDRERIARELHDTVIQRLFATGMGVQALATRVSEPEVAERLGRVVDDLDTTIRDIRTAIFGLQGGVFGAGVRAEVLKVAHEAVPALGMEPRVRFLGPVDAVVGPEVAEHLVPTLREALANVARHARASRVEVTLRCTSERAHLQVADDGVGPPTGDAVAPGDGLTGRGLRNVARRAEALGGTCVLRPGPDGGSVLEWDVAVAGLDDDED